jgi:CBS domain-containing membrane protein
MRHRTTTVEDVMTTALTTIHPDQPVELADLEMQLTDCRHIPVVGAKNQLVGILSHRDLLRSLAGPSGRSIGDIMTRRVHTVHANDPARRAIDLLLEHKIGCVPVLGEQEELVGIVTETDFLRVARESLRD